MPIEPTPDLILEIDFTAKNNVTPALSEMQTEMQAAGREADALEGRISASFKGIEGTIVSSLGPIKAELASLGAESSATTVKIAGLGGAAETVRAGLTGLNSGLASVRSGMSSVSKDLGTVSSSLSRTSTQLKAVQTEAQGAAPALRSVGVSGREASTVLGKVGTSGKEAYAALREVSSAGKSADNALSGVALRGKGAGDALGQIRDLGRPAATALRDVSTEGGRAAGILTTVGTEGKGAGVSLGRVEKSGAAAATSLREVNTSARSLAPNLVKVDAEARAVAISLGDVDAAAIGAATELGAVGTEAATLGGEFATLSGQIAAEGAKMVTTFSEVEAAAARMNLAMKAATGPGGGGGGGNRISQIGAGAAGALPHVSRLHRAVTDLGGALSKLGSLFIGGGAVGGFGIYEALKTGVGFHQTEQAVAGNTNMNDRQRLAMEAFTKSLMSKGPETYQDISKGYLHAASVFSSDTPAQLAQIITAAWKSAIGSRGAMEPIANALVSAMHNWKIEADQALQTQDLLHSIGAYGNMTLEQLSANMGRSSAYMATLGVSIPQWGSLFDTLTKLLGPAQTNTQLTGLAAQLIHVRPTALPTLLKLQEDTGISVLKDWNAAGVARKGIYPVLQELNQATLQEAGGNRAEQLKLLGNIVPGQRGLIGLSTLFRNLPEALATNRKLGGIEGPQNATGTGGGPGVKNITDTQFLDMMKQAGPKLGTFKNDLRLVGITISDIVLPAILKLGESIAPLLAKFDQWAEKHKAVIVEALKIGGALAGVALAVKAITMVGDPFLLIGKSLLALGPLGLPVAIALGAIAAAVVLVATHWKEVSAAWNSDSTNLANLKSALGAVQDALGTIGNALGTLMTNLTGVSNSTSGTQQNMAALKTVLHDASVVILDVARGIDGVAHVFATFSSALVPLGAGILAYKTFMLGAASATRTMALAQGALDLVLLANPIGLFIAALVALGAMLVYTYTHVQSFRTAVDNLGAGLKSMFESVGSANDRFTALMTSKWSTMTSALSRANTNFTALVVGAWNSLFGDLGRENAGFTQDVLSKWHGMTDLLGRSWSGWASALGPTLSAALSVIRNGISGLAAALPASWQKMGHDYDAMTGGWVKSTTTGLSNVKNAVSSWVISVSGTFLSAGKSLGDAISQGLHQALPGFMSTLDQWNTAFTNWVNQKLTDLGTLLHKAVTLLGGNSAPTGGPSTNISGGYTAGATYGLSGAASSNRFNAGSAVMLNQKTGGAVTGNIMDTDFPAPKGTNVQLPGGGGTMYKLVSQGVDPNTGGYEVWQAPNGGKIMFLHTSSNEGYQKGSQATGGTVVAQTGAPLTRQFGNDPNFYHLCVVTDAGGRQELMWLTSDEMKQQTQANAPQSSFSSQVTSAIDTASAANGLPAGLLASVVKSESGGNPGLTSPKGAMGLLQLMPDTARGLHVANPYNAQQSAQGGAKYLEELYSGPAKGNWETALEMYNAGPGASKALLNRTARYKGDPNAPKTYADTILKDAGLNPDGSSIIPGYTPPAPGSSPKTSGPYPKVKVEPKKQLTQAQIIAAAREQDKKLSKLPPGMEYVRDPKTGLVEYSTTPTFTDSLGHVEGGAVYALQQPIPSGKTAKPSTASLKAIADNAWWQANKTWVPGTPGHMGPNEKPVAPTAGHWADKAMGSSFAPQYVTNTGAPSFATTMGLLKTPVGAQYASPYQNPQQAQKGLEQMGSVTIPNMLKQINLLPSSLGDPLKASLTALAAKWQSAVTGITQTLGTIDEQHNANIQAIKSKFARTRAEAVTVAGIRIGVGKQKELFAAAAIDEHQIKPAVAAHDVTVAAHRVWHPAVSKTNVYTGEVEKKPGYYTEVGPSLKHVAATKGGTYDKAEELRDLAAKTGLSETVIKELLSGKISTSYGNERAALAAADRQWKKQRATAIGRYDQQANALFQGSAKLEAQIQKIGSPDKVFDALSTQYSGFDTVGTKTIALAMYTNMKSGAGLMDGVNGALKTLLPGMLDAARHSNMLAKGLARASLLVDSALGRIDDMVTQYGNLDTLARTKSYQSLLAGKGVNQDSINTITRDAVAVQNLNLLKDRESIAEALSVGRATGDIATMQGAYTTSSNDWRAESQRSLLAGGGVDPNATAAITANTVQTQQLQELADQQSRAEALAIGDLGAFASALGTTQTALEQNATRSALAGQGYDAASVAAYAHNTQIQDQAGVVTAGFAARVDLAGGKLSTLTSDFGTLSTYLTNEVMKGVVSGQGVNQSDVSQLDTIAQANALIQRASDGLAAIITADTGSFAAMGSALSTLAGADLTDWERAVLTSGTAANTFSAQLVKDAVAAADFVHLTNLENVAVGELTGDAAKLSTGLAGLVTEAQGGMDFFEGMIGRTTSVLAPVSGTVTSFASSIQTAVLNLGTFSGMLSGTSGLIATLKDVEALQLTKTGTVDPAAYAAQGNAFGVQNKLTANQISTNLVGDFKSGDIISYLSDVNGEIQALQSHAATAYAKGDTATYTRLEGEIANLQSLTSGLQLIINGPLKPGDTPYTAEQSRDFTYATQLIQQNLEPVSSYLVEFGGILNDATDPVKDLGNAATTTQGQVKDAGDAAALLAANLTTVANQILQLPTELAGALSNVQVMNVTASTVNLDQAGTTPPPNTTAPGGTTYPNGEPVQTGPTPAGTMTAAQRAQYAFLVGNGVAPADALSLVGATPAHPATATSTAPTIDPSGGSSGLTQQQRYQYNNLIANGVAPADARAIVTGSVAAAPTTSPSTPVTKPATSPAPTSQNQPAPKTNIPVDATPITKAAATGSTVLAKGVTTSSQTVAQSFTVGGQTFSVAFKNGAEVFSQNGKTVATVMVQAGGTVSQDLILGGQKVTVGLTQSGDSVAYAITSTGPVVSGAIDAATTTGADVLINGGTQTAGAITDAFGPGIAGLNAAGPSIGGAIGTATAFAVAAIEGAVASGLAGIQSAVSFAGSSESLSGSGPLTDTSGAAAALGGLLNTAPSTGGAGLNPATGQPVGDQTQAWWFNQGVFDKASGNPQRTVNGSSLDASAYNDGYNSTVAGTGQSVTPQGAPPPTAVVPPPVPVLPPGVNGAGGSSTPPTNVLPGPVDLPGNPLTGASGGGDTGSAPGPTTTPPTAPGDTGSGGSAGSGMSISPDDLIALQKVDTELKDASGLHTMALRMLGGTKGAGIITGITGLSPQGTTLGTAATKGLTDPAHLIGAADYFTRTAQGTIDQMVFNLQQQNASNTANTATTLATAMATPVNTFGGFVNQFGQVIGGLNGLGSPHPTGIGSVTTAGTSFSGTGFTAGTGGANLDMTPGANKDTYDKQYAYYMSQSYGQQTSEIMALTDAMMNYFSSPANTGWHEGDPVIDPRAAADSFARLTVLGQGTNAIVADINNGNGYVTSLNLAGQPVIPGLTTAQASDQVMAGLATNYTSYLSQMTGSGLYSTNPDGSSSGGLVTQQYASWVANGGLAALGDTPTGNSGGIVPIGPGVFAIVPSGDTASIGSNGFYSVTNPSGGAVPTSSLTGYNWLGGVTNNLGYLSDIVGGAYYPNLAASQINLAGAGGYTGSFNQPTMPTGVSGLSAQSGLSYLQQIAASSGATAQNTAQTAQNTYLTTQTMDAFQSDIATWMRKLANYERTSANRQIGKATDFKSWEDNLGIAGVANLAGG